MVNMKYYDFNNQVKKQDINLVFPEWKNSEETIVVFAPHDDDAVLGAGYILTAAQRSGAECYVFIFCNGSCGYSQKEQKDEIVEIRKKETVNAYQKMDIEKEHLIRFEYPDFSAYSRIGWKLPGGKKGNLEKTIKKLREINATRVIIPNGYREHFDHKAVNMMGVYDVPQAGDPVAIDWGEPADIKSVLIYSVWADFSPEDALKNDRDTKIRANCALEVDPEVEDRIIAAVKEYKSQAQIIENLIEQRKRKKIKNNYLELYQKIDPRPQLDYNPYIKLIKERF